MKVKADVLLSINLFNIIHKWGTEAIFSRYIEAGYDWAFPEEKLVWSSGVVHIVYIFCAARHKMVAEKRYTKKKCTKKNSDIILCTNMT